MLVKTTTTDIDTATASQQLCKSCHSFVDATSLDPITGLCPICLQAKKDIENGANPQPQI
jgi:Zn finger protein HypA/HybF involved in hydrogenase expression